MNTAVVKKAIIEIVGKENASFLKEDRLCYSYDATSIQELPDAVVFPKDAGEVSLILKLAAKEGFPVVPRGAGSGYTGGSVPIDGGVVISTERMLGINIDEENLTVEVGAGVITGELQDEVEKLGLFYPPDPTSLKFSSIGGNISESAGGPRAVKYGTTRDYVLSLEVVLASGDVIQTGVNTMKGVVGYDLTRLIVGSEGTLGVVTKALLRLIPLPEETTTIYVSYDDLNDAARTVSGIIKERVIPSTLELIDGESLKCVSKYAESPLKDADAVLLIEVDGTAIDVKREAGIIERICKENASKEFKVATDKFEKKDIWKVRRDISPSLYKIKPKKINEDVVVPRSRLTELVMGVREIAGRNNVIIASFGHAGDGNLHVNVMVDSEDKDEARRGDKAIEEVFDLTLSLGGTISGEHGVGLTKAPYIAKELSVNALNAMQSIKTALDPKGILNPRKIFPPEK